MDVRYAVHMDHAKSLDTEGLRRHFLVERVFVPDSLSLTYSHVDRIIVGGAMPVTGTVTVGADVARAIAAPYLLDRRELGLINLGGPAVVEVDGEAFPVARHDGLYVTAGTRELAFTSESASDPAKLYLACAPAHRRCTSRRITREQASTMTLGDAVSANRRTIRKYVNPDVVESCQLSLGFTTLEPGSVWNTMPCHTHERRMEVYFYCGLPDDAMVLHLMGLPTETRHVVVHNEQAVISPAWSLHAGVGTQAYSFVWAMVGENQTYDDMDHVKVHDLR
jgi:4-deoxy-L-threo-5-hexosulose-uronate ketol-isomerase